MILTREGIFGAKDLPLVEVEVPEWEGSVFVRSMNAEERGDLEKRFQGREAQDDPCDFRATILALTVTDAEGGLLFTLDDIAALKKKGAKPVENIFEVSCRINGFTKKDVADIEKN